jgi:hypothetical protein
VQVWAKLAQRGNPKHHQKRRKYKDGKFGSSITWNLKASSMDRIGVFPELLRKKAFLT